MRDKLKNMDSETMAFSTINMNSFSDAPSLQGTLEQPLEKKSGQLSSDTAKLLCTFLYNVTFTLLPSERTEVDLNPYTL